MSDGVNKFQDPSSKEAATQSGSVNATETGFSQIQESVAPDGSRAYTCDGNTLNPHTQHLYKKASELYWGQLASYIGSVSEISKWSPSFRGANYKKRRSNQTALTEAQKFRDKFARIYHTPPAGELMTKEEALTEAAAWVAGVSALVGNQNSTSGVMLDTESAPASNASQS